MRRFTRLLVPLILILLTPLPFIYAQSGPVSPLSGNVDRPISTWAADQAEGEHSPEPPPPLDEPDPDNPFDVMPSDPPTFFGEDLIGSKIVFCLDNSCSMGVPHPWYSGIVQPPGGTIVSIPTRWQAVQTEATAAIAAFPETVEFDVVIYNSSSSSCFGALVEAAGGTKAQAISWIWSVSHYGGTNTRPALNWAFNGYSLELDMLVFLSDGWIPYGVQGDSAANVAAQQSETFKFLVVQIGGAAPNPGMVALGALPHSEYIFR